MTAVAPVNRAALVEALAGYRVTPPPALFTIVPQLRCCRCLCHPSPDAGIEHSRRFFRAFARQSRSRQDAWRETLDARRIAIGAEPGFGEVPAAFAKSDGARLAFFNDVTSPLAAGADIVLDQHAGEEP